MSASRRWAPRLATASRARHEIHSDPAKCEFLRSRGDECRSRRARGSRRKMRAKYLDRDGRADEAPIRSSRGMATPASGGAISGRFGGGWTPSGARIRREVEAPGWGKPAGGVLGRQPGGKWNQSKTVLQNNGLHGNCDHGCVLFVQHLSRNGLTHPVWSGSFVACAEVFGNCHLATEGGIPRSSR